MANEDITSSEELFRRAIVFHQKGEFDSAEQTYLKLLQNDPKNSAALINIGQLLNHQKRFDAAAKFYQRSVALPDPPLEAWFNLGNLQLDQQQYSKAAESFRNVLRLKASFAPAHFQLGRVLRGMYKVEQAVDHFMLAIQNDPKLESAYIDLGNCLRSLGRTDEAVVQFREGLKLNQASWKLQYNLARVYEQQGLPDLFTKHFEQAVLSAPDQWLLHYSLAQTRYDNRDYEGAESAYRTAVQIDPHRLEAAVGLGAVLVRLDKDNEANRIFRKISLVDDVVILSSLANTLSEAKRWREAIAILEKCALLRPDLFDTHFNLASAYSINYALDKALHECDKALTVSHDNSRVLALQADILLKQGRVEEGLKVYWQDYRNKESPFAVVASSIAFASLYSDLLTAEEKIDLHKQLTSSWRQSVSSKQIANKDPQKRLRIGYVSGDFRDQHPVSIFITPVLQNHDRSQFEVFCYYNSMIYEGSTRQTMKYCDNWREVGGWSDERLAALIGEDQIDILVDLSGQTSANRLQMFAGRPAPLQVSLIGYPHSTGLSEMDYLIADPLVAPPQHDHLCSEKIERLPHCVFCLPPQSSLYGPVRNVANSRSRIVFGSFNNLPKINDSTISLWSRILRELPDAVLKLKSPSFQDKGTRERYFNLFREQGIQRNRLYIVGPSSLVDMMKEYGDLDIALDPIPYNGGTTTFQALWMGIPVVTLKGDNFCSRMGYSILSNLGLPELVADSIEQYIEIAVNLAGDPKRLADLRNGMRDRMLASPLCDTGGYTKDLEKIYRRIWHRYLHG